MAKDLMKYLETARPRSFEPRPYYGPEEDSLTFYFHKAESYGKRVDELLTLFLSVKADVLVGCQVKGVRKNLKRLGRFGIAVKHGKVRLDLFFISWPFWRKSRNNGRNTWTSANEPRMWKCSSMRNWSGLEAAYVQGAA